jgi:hypothetical protein
MKKGILITLLVAVVGGAAGLWYMFKGTEKHLLLIPKDAAMVVNVDFKSLATKMDFEKMKEFAWFKDAQKEMKEGDASSKRMSEIMESPLSTGINFMSPIFYFNEIKDNNMYNAVVFDIRSSSDFESTVIKADENLKIEEGPNFKWVKLGGGGGLAWSSTGGMFFMNTQSFMGDDEESSGAPEFVASAFSRDKANSIMSNDKFAEHIKGAKDISYFINGGNYMKMILPYALGSGLMADLSYMENTYMSGYLEFQEGNVQFSSRVLSDNPEYAKIKEITSASISSDQLKNITDKDVYGALALKLDMTKLWAMLNEIKAVQKGKPEILQTLGVSESELESLLGGEFTFALTNFTKEVDPMQAELVPEQLDAMDEMDRYEYQYTHREPDMMPMFTLSFSSSNKELLKKILNEKMVSQGSLAFADGMYSTTSTGDFHGNLVETSTGFMFTNDKSIASKAMSGSLAAAPEKISNLANNQFMAAYMNLSLATYPDLVKQELVNNMGRSYSMFETYMSVFKEARLQQNTDKGTFDLQLSEGSGNSLFRLMKQADEVYKMTRNPS